MLLARNQRPVVLPLASLRNPTITSGPTWVLLLGAEEEKEVLKSLKENNSVIALGGGAFLNEIARKEILENTISIWLDVSTENLNKRIKWNDKRPLLGEVNNEEKIKELYIKRKDIYKLANHKINCDNLTKENIVEK